MTTTRRNALMIFAAGSLVTSLTPVAAQPVPVPLPRPRPVEAPIADALVKALQAKTPAEAFTILRIALGIKESYLPPERELVYLGEITKTIWNRYDEDTWPRSYILSDYILDQMRYIPKLGVRKTRFFE